MHKRQPFNHPTLMFKKSEVLRVGSYPHIKQMEDKIDSMITSIYLVSSHKQAK